MKKTVFYLCLLASVLLILTCPEAIAQEAVNPDKATFKDIIGLFKDVNIVNVILLSIAVFAGRMWFLGRSRLKMLADIFMKAYEYTDDKRLSDAERDDIIKRFFEIIGKKK